MMKPAMVWMAPPCTEWCGFSRLNYDRQERRRRRAREVVFLKLIDNVLAEQRAGGRLAVVENPRSSDIWRHPILQRWIMDPEIYLAKVDLCSYGMVSSDYNVPLRKPLTLLCNDSCFAAEIAKTCDHSHEHQVVQGTQTAYSAIYTTAFANAIVKAFDRRSTSTGGSHVAFPAASEAVSKVLEKAHEETL